MLSFQLVQTFIAIIGLHIFAGFSGCDHDLQKKETPAENWNSLRVTASAYNSVEYQTGTGNPAITAWGDTLQPGMKVIAVSRDLIKKGLDHNTPVKIKGLDGVFLVQDKMHYRWRNKIDIYMGEDVRKARQWGMKKVDILYLVENDNLHGKE